MSQQLTRRQILSRGLGLGSAVNLAGQPARRPNIVLLLTDDQRYDTVRALGHEIVRTPHMDELVRAGTAFTGASIMGSTISAVCTPSRAMLLTGQHLFHAHDNLLGGASKPPVQRRRHAFHLFPELLGNAGYRTFFSGKWGNGKKVLNRCFQDARNIFFRWGPEANQALFPISGYDPSGSYPASAEKTANRFTSEVFTDAALEFLESHRSSEPFFLYTAYLSPHDPRTPPPQFASLYDPAKIPLPANFQPEHIFYNGHNRNRDELLAPLPRTPEVIRRHLAGYYGMISEVDYQIGRILRALEATGHAQNTVVILASDNGLAVGQHGLLGKQNLYEHSIRVPLVIRGPGFAAGKRIDAPVYLHDLCPTICELAGLPIPATVASTSLMPLLNNRREAFRGSTFHAFRHLHRAVRREGWKLIVYNVNGIRTTQLFNLLEDPLERRNLAGERTQVSRIRDMMALLSTWARSTEDYIDLDRPDWGGVTLGAGE
jgi:arylsulfatase A-like enzyme